MLIPKLELQLRTVNPDQDFSALVQLLTEIEATDQAGSNPSAAGLRAQFAWPGHDPRQDRWVIESPTAPGKLIAHGWLFAQSQQRAILGGAVHPQWRRQGLGRQLLSTAIARAQAKGARQIVAGARAKQKAGQAFLAASQFVQVGHNRFMKAPADTPIETPVWPAGFTVRTFAELGDVAVLVAGSNGCYTDMWGHRENTEPASIAHFQESLAKYPDFYVPEGIFVLFAPDGAVAGICFNRLDREDQQKVLDSPGIAPAYRHLGLHRPLVQASMQWLNTQADGMFHLDTWGDFDEAVQIYEELGFTLADENHLLEYLLKTTS